MLLATLFFLSGFAALVYQLIWHRALYAIYGIDITSVTMVVTAFMLGLGCGSVLGGVLSRPGRRGLLGTFAALEFGIGAFGYLSLDLFAWAGTFTLDVSGVGTAWVTFLLVLLPTTLMGASLPILVAFATRRSGSVGRSVGLLYFANTLGGALGCYAAAALLLGFLGLKASTQVASAVNVALGVAVLALRERLA
jgi:predicted membrane-bound spermidine synthase